MDASSLGQLRLSWVLRLRWATMVAQLLALLVSATFLTTTAPAAVAVVVAGGFVNVIVRALLSRAPARDVPDRVVAGAVCADVVLLTVLLALLGGPSNPFVLLYVLHLAVAAIALPRRFAVVIAVVVAAGWCALFLPSVSDPSFHLHPSDGPAFAAHVRGTWVAFLLTGGLLVAFLSEMSAALRSGERDAEKARRLASLATLAGGAAHELATPLSTIAVVVGELQRRVRGGDAAVVEDVALLGREVERCKQVLSQMAADAGAPRGDSIGRVAVKDLVSDVVAGLDRVDVRVVDDAVVVVPRRPLAQALRGLVKNALQASDARVEVVVDGVVVSIVDSGGGMTPETLERIGEPFFTTKPTGQGMGLGVFLAKTVLEQCGGRLRFTSTPGRGTTATVELSA